MTLGLCWSDVKDRLSQFITTPMLDDQSIHEMINWARRDVCVRLLPYRREFFLHTGTSVSDGATIPYDMLGSRPLRVLLGGSNIEARYFKPNEFFFNAGGINGLPSTVNPATTGAPICTIWGDASNTRVLLTAPASLTGTMDYFKGLADLATDGSADASDLGVPSGYEISVIYGAMWRCLLKVNEQNKAVTIFKNYTETFMNLEGSQNVEKLSRRMSLQSLPIPTRELDTLDEEQK